MCSCRKTYRHARRATGMGIVRPCPCHADRNIVSKCEQMLASRIHRLVVLPWFARCAMLRRRNVRLDVRRIAMRIFGSLESQIMPILWREGQAKVKQVHRELIDWRDLAYTTVMTTMERLTETGVLRRWCGARRAYAVGGVSGGSRCRRCRSRAP